MYFQNWTNKAGKVLIHPGRFVGFAWNVGDPMTFKVLMCNIDPHKRNMVAHRGAVVPRNLEATGYNSALAPNIDAYFPQGSFIRWDPYHTSHNRTVGDRGYP